MDVAKAIAQFTAQKAGLAAANLALMEAATDQAETLNQDQQNAFDGNAADIATIDAHIGRLRTIEGGQAASAIEPNGSSQADAAASRGVPRVIVKAQEQLEPGVEFARAVMMFGRAKGIMGEAARIAAETYGPNANVVGLFRGAQLGWAGVQRAPVPAGATDNWAAALVGEDGKAYADFVEFLRPQTILGVFGTNGVPALRRVPFRVALISQTAGGAGYWVGEGKAKPLTSFDFGRTVLEPLKVANIAALTDEVVRDSSPSAELVVRDALAGALIERMDTDFIDPAKVAVAGESPASVTNGAPNVASSGSDADAVRADVAAVFALFLGAHNPPRQGVWIMSSANALGLSMLMTPLGVREFPQMSMLAGGSFMGLPAIVTDYAGDTVALVNASDIYLADDGGIAIDLSREASLVMDSAPAMDSTVPTAAQVVSMFQTNTVAFRAERVINWARRRPVSVAYITGAAWGQPEPPATLGGAAMEDGNKADADTIEGDA
jgi:hypothetical protein